MASREELLANIKPDMNLTKKFLKRIYGYNISHPSFSKQAIVALESAGCSKARDHYKQVVSEYELAHEAEMKDVARWYMAECEKKWKNEGGERQRSQKKNNSITRRKKRLTDLIERLESQ